MCGLLVRGSQVEPSFQVFGGCLLVGTPLFELAFSDFFGHCPSRSEQDERFAIKPLIGSFFGSYSEVRARSTVARLEVKAGDH